MKFLTPIEYFGYYKLWANQSLSGNAIEGTGSISLTNEITDEIQFGEVVKLRFGSTVIKAKRVDSYNLVTTEPLPRTILSTEQPYLYIAVKATESEHAVTKRDLDIAIESLKRTMSGEFGQKTKLVFFTNLSGAIINLVDAIEYDSLTEQVMCTFYERNSDNTYSEAVVKYKISGTELNWSCPVAFNGFIRISALKITH